MKRFIAPALFFLAAGTVEAKDYVAPTKPPLATLTVDNRTGAVIIPATFAQPKNCKGMLKLAKGNWAIQPVMFPDQSLTVPIDASKEFTLYIESTAGSSLSSTASCRIILAFKPEADAHYVATARTGDSGCYLSIERESTAGDGSKTLALEASTRRREIPELTIGFGPQCRSEDAASPAK